MFSIRSLSTSGYSQISELDTVEGCEPCISQMEGSHSVPRRTLTFLAKFTMAEARCPIYLHPFQYEFIYERQAISDYNDYCRLKRRTQSGDKTELPADSQDGTCRSHSLSSPSPDVSAVANSDPPPLPPEEVPSPPTDQRPTSPILSNPPPVTVPDTEPVSAPIPHAANQIVFNEILKPQPISNKTANDQRISSSAEAVIGMDGLTEFQPNSDDPFASAELQAINDLDELQNVLTSSSIHPIISKLPTTARSDLSASCPQGPAGFDVSQPSEIRASFNSSPNPSANTAHLTDEQSGESAQTIPNNTTVPCPSSTYQMDRLTPTLPPATVTTGSNCIAFTGIPVCKTMSVPDLRVGVYFSQFTYFMLLCLG